jgi:hypothetical protein
MGLLLTKLTLWDSVKVANRQLGGALRTQVWLARTYWGCEAMVIMRKSSTLRVSIFRLATVRLLGRRGSVW